MQIDQERLDAFLTRISQVLGPEKVSALSNRQDRFLSQAFGRLLKRKPPEQISDAEIEGQYYLVVEHTSPLAYEVRRRNSND
jgi:hypothetical protein